MRLKIHENMHQPTSTQNLLALLKKGVIKFVCTKDLIFFFSFLLVSLTFCFSKQIQINAIKISDRESSGCMKSPLGLQKFLRDLAK